MIIEQDKFITITKEEQENYLRSINIDKDKNGYMRGWLVYYDSTIKSLAYVNELNFPFRTKDEDDWIYPITCIMGYDLEDAINRLKDIKFYLGEKKWLNNTNLSKVTLDELYQNPSIFRFHKTDNCRWNVKYEVKDWKLRILGFYINEGGYIRNEDFELREIDIPHKRKIKDNFYRAWLDDNHLVQYTNEEEFLKAVIDTYINISGGQTHRLGVEDVLPFKIYEDWD